MNLRSLPASLNATASQVLSSVRSLAFLVLSARALTPEQFGLVAIVTTAAIALNEILRATASHPLALSFDESPVEDDRPLGQAVSLHVLLAAAVAGLASAMLLAAGERTGSALVAGSLCYVPVAWLDALRTGSINRGRADRSVLIDGGWTLLLLGALPLILAQSPSALAAVLVWGATAAAAALSATLLCRLRLSALSARSYWRRVSGVARPLAIQVGLESVPTRIAPLVIASMVGATAAASIRGSEVLLGGAAMVYSGMGAASLRQARQQFVTAPWPAVVRGVVARFGLVLFALACNLGLVLLLPEKVGVALLGDSWTDALSFAPIQALVLASLVIFAMVSVLMRAQLAMHELVRIDVLGALIAVVLVPSATAVAGAEAGLAAIAVVVLAMVVFGVNWLVRSDTGAARL